MTKRAEMVRRVDFGLIVSVILLLAGSMLVLRSIALGSPEAAGFAAKQTIWAMAGLVLMAAAAFFNYNRLRHYSIILFGTNIAMLVAILVSGKIALGAQRWISIAGFRFQPSEFTKLLVIITLAAFLAEKKGELGGVKDVLLALAYASPSIVLILLQPDLGTALVIGAAVVGMLVVAGIKPRHLAAMAGLTYLAGWAVWHFRLLHEYQMKRLIVFLNPEVDPLGSGYNLRQSIIAIGSGGVLGTGLVSGTQSRLDFLPPSVRHTDFVFAVIGEELGFVGGFGLILIFFFMIMRALRIATLSRSYFGTILAAGIVSMWLFQVMVNIGMTIGIMPITGIPLPFISYGGSSLMMNMIAAGMLLSIYSRRWD